MSTTYTVRAKRWTHGWELHIDGEGVTQARSLATAVREVRDYLETLHDLDDTSGMEIVIVPELDKTTVREVKEARAAVADAAERQRRAADLSRSAVNKLAKSGLKGAEIAAVLGVSPQRVSQIAAGAGLSGQGLSGKSAKVAAKRGGARVAAKRAKSPTPKRVRESAAKR